MVGGKIVKTLYNTNLQITGINEEKYNMLIDFLEDNNIAYNEDDFEEFIVDERTEDERYEDWLWDQVDKINDEKKVN